MALQMTYTFAMTKNDHDEILERLHGALGKVPAELLPLLDRHQLNLRMLVETLRQAGHPPAVVRASVHDLLVAYEADLLAALDGMGDE